MQKILKLANSETDAKELELCQVTVKRQGVTPSLRNKLCCTSCKVQYVLTM